MKAFFRPNRSTVRQLLGVHPSGEHHPHPQKFGAPSGIAMPGHIRENIVHDNPIDGTAQQIAVDLRGTAFLTCWLATSVSNTHEPDSFSS